MRSTDNYADQIKLVNDMITEAIADRAARGLWKTEDGRVLAIKSMQTDHLRRVYRYFTEGPGVDAPGAAAMNYVRDELKRREAL